MRKSGILACIIANLGKIQDFGKAEWPPLWVLYWWLLWLLPNIPKKRLSRINNLTAEQNSWTCFVFGFFRGNAICVRGRIPYSSWLLRDDIVTAMRVSYICVCNPCDLRCYLAYGAVWKFAPSYHRVLAFCARSSDCGYSSIAVGWEDRIAAGSAMRGMSGRRLWTGEYLPV